MVLEEVLPFVHDEIDLSYPMLREVDMHPLLREPHMQVFVCFSVRILFHCSLPLEGADSLSQGVHLTFFL